MDGPSRDDADPWKKTGRKILDLNRKSAIAIVLLAAAVAAPVVGVSYAFPYFQICIGNPTSVQFTIIMTSQGFNGSKSHVTDPWPVMNVKRCQRVTFHLENQDTVLQSHGFAITNYLDSGVEVRHGQTDDVTINANRSGSFLVYCNILCTIHLNMQNGRLNVT